MSAPVQLTLLVNNPFRTDSRSWKIARSAAEAGLSVTVVALPAPGLPEREERDGWLVMRVARPMILRGLPIPGLPAGDVQAIATSGSDSRAASAMGRLGGLVRGSLGRLAQGIRYLVLARRWARAIADAVPAADIWHVKGLILLPVALELRRLRGGKVVYDSVDIHVEAGRFARLPGPWRRLLGRGERAWARSADAVVTVSEAYGGVLGRQLGVEPVIVMNCPSRWQPPDPPIRSFHERLGLADDTRVVLYLGQVVAHRGIEQLFEAIALVDRAALAVVGYGSDWDAFRARAAALPHADRIHVLPGLEPESILEWTAAADVAAMPVQASTLNHRLNTPTKLFDAMGAGTPVVASDLPGMAPIVRDTGCGVLCDPTDPADIARAIREVIDAPVERRAAFREACLAAARGPYSWERQADRLLDLYRRLIGATP